MSETFKENQQLIEQSIKTCSNILLHTLKIVGKENYIVGTVHFGENQYSLKFEKIDLSTDQ